VTWDADTAEALRDSLSRWLADHLDLSVQGRADRPPAPPVWRALATELGLLGVGLPERVGGLGGGLAAQLQVLRTLGGWLTAEPYAGAAVVGGAALQAAATPQADALLARLVAGDARPAFAHLEPAARTLHQAPRCTLRRDGGGWRLDGRKAAVAGAPGATHFVVTAVDEAGPVVVCLAADVPGLALEAGRLLDGSEAATLHLDAVPVADQAWLGGAALVDRLLDTATLASCAEALGVLQRLQADTVEHLRTRQQFGQPLAAFQVLQHRLADLHIARVQAEALTWAVAEGFEAAGADERALAVSSAALAVDRACRAVGQGAVQLHGAMGVTEELAAARFARRALQIGLQHGDRLHHLQRCDRLLHPER
jgi:alkylation response protein AidB-like acyl-CoA dehydrogenase